MKGESPAEAGGGEAAGGCRVVVVCSDQCAARQAMDDYGHLIEACEPDRYCARWWWFRDLDDEDRLSEALAAAETADYLIIGAPADPPVARRVKEWLEAVLRRERRPARLIGVLGCPMTEERGEGLTNAFLCALAAEAGVPYTVHWYEMPGCSDAGTYDHLGERAGEVTTVLSGILTRTPQRADFARAPSS